MMSSNQDGVDLFSVKMNSKEQCNAAHADLMAFLGGLNISDESKDQIITLSSNVARYAAISGMEASKHIAVQMLCHLSALRRHRFSA